MLFQTAGSRCWCGWRPIYQALELGQCSKHKKWCVVKQTARCGKWQTWNWMTSIQTQEQLRQWTERLWIGRPVLESCQQSGIWNSALISSSHIPVFPSSGFRTHRRVILTLLKNGIHLEYPISDHRTDIEMKLQPYNKTNYIVNRKFAKRMVLQTETRK
jgi:hypothetical protein